MNAPHSFMKPVMPMITSSKPAMLPRPGTWLTGIDGWLKKFGRKGVGLPRRGRRYASEEEMNNHEKQFWEDIPYGDYLNAVDDQLESLIGRTSIQSELTFIADMQEALELPLETTWAIAKESFSPKAQR
jgi:hypothetical protein